MAMAITITTTAITIIDRVHDEAPVDARDHHARLLCGLPAMLA
jgi:hypothetical protein